METVAPDKEIIEVIRDSGGDAFKLCFQCGLCDAVCPWNRVANFSMRKLVREATFGLTEIEKRHCAENGQCHETIGLGGIPVVMREIPQRVEDAGDQRSGQAPRESHDEEDEKKHGERLPDKIQNPYRQHGVAEKTQC